MFTKLYSVLIAGGAGRGAYFSDNFIRFLTYCGSCVNIILPRKGQGIT